MGLRDFLANLQGVTAATAGAAESTGKLRQELAMQQYQQQLPSIIESGDQKALASAAAGAGDMEMLRMLLGNQQKLQAKEAPASEEYLVGQEAASGMKLPRGLPQSQIDKILSTGQAKKASEMKQGMFDESQERLKTKQLETSAVDFSKDLTKVFDEAEDKKIKLKGALERFLTTPSADNARSLGTALARGSGANGVLTELDVSSYIPKSFKGDLKQFLGYLSEKPELIIQNQEMLAHIQKNAQGMIGNLDELYNKRLDDHFISRVKTNKQLLQDKNYREVVDEWAARRGYEPPELKDGKTILRKKANTSGLIEGKTGATSKIPEWTDGLPQDVKNHLFKSIEGKDLTEKSWDVIKANIKKGYQGRKDLRL